MDYVKARELALENPGSVIRPAPDGDGHVVHDADGNELAPNACIHDVARHSPDDSNADSGSGTAGKTDGLGETERAQLLGRISDLERDRLESLTLLADSQAVVAALRSQLRGNSSDGGHMRDQLEAARSRASEYKSDAKRLRKKVASLQQELDELKKGALSLVAKQVAKARAEESAKRQKLQQQLSECRKKLDRLRTRVLPDGGSNEIRKVSDPSAADAKRTSCRCMGEVENCHWCDGKGYYFTDANGHRI